MQNCRMPPNQKITFTIWLFFQKILIVFGTHCIYIHFIYIYEGCKSLCRTSKDFHIWTYTLYSVHTYTHTQTHEHWTVNIEHWTMRICCFLSSWMVIMLLKRVNPFRNFFFYMWNFLVYYSLNKHHHKIKRCIYVNYKL